MLTADPRLRFLQLAWSADHMTEVLDQRVLPRLLPGAQLTGTTIEDVTYSPGRKCFVLYSLQFAGACGALPTRALATFAKDDRLTKIYADHYGGNADRSTAAAVVDEYQCLVELFPTDWQLPTLTRAMSPSERGATVDTIHYCPHRRCVLRYSSGGGPGAIGKLFSSVGEAVDAWERLRAVKSRPPAFPVPEPLGLFPDLNLVMMAEVPGAPLSALLENEPMPDVAERGVHIAARGLAALHDHSGHFCHGRQRTLRGDIGSLRQRNTRLHLVAAEFARRVDTLLDRLESAAGNDAEQVALIHGDFKPSQLLIDDGCAHLVDFDAASPGDPAIDVGNFAAQLRKAATASDRLSLSTLADGFVAEYRSASGGAPLGARVGVVEAISLARLAVRGVRHAPHECLRSGSRSLPARLLEEAERCSAQL